MKDAPFMSDRERDAARRAAMKRAPAARYRRARRRLRAIEATMDAFRDHPSFAHRNRLERLTERTEVEAWAAGWSDGYGFGREHPPLATKDVA